MPGTRPVITRHRSDPSAEFRLQSCCGKRDWLRPRALESQIGRLAQLVRAPALHAGSRGFESLIAHLSIIEKRTYGLTDFESERLRTTPALSPMEELVDHGKRAYRSSQRRDACAHRPLAQKAFGKTRIRPDLLTQIRAPIGRRNNRRHRPKPGKYGYFKLTLGKILPAVP